MIRRVNAEPAVLFGAGRALLLQLAHPSVAQGVADHSDFQHDPLRRLQGTLEATYAVVFGTDALAAAVGRRIRWVHDRITGPTYAANDPENLLWVHATLTDTALGCYERLVRTLSDADREAYYQEMAVVAETFGCPRSAQPATYAAFRAYFDEQVQVLEVTDVGRSLARDVVRPSLPWRLEVPLAPAVSVQRLVAVGTTPPRLREQLGFDWDRRRARRLDRVLDTARTIFRATPRRLRIAPGQLQGRYLLWLAARHTADFDARVSAQPA
jgi:uncharacterized protein (DUF2236 family)